MKDSVLNKKSIKRILISVLIAAVINISLRLSFNIILNPLESGILGGLTYIILYFGKD